MSQEGHRRRKPSDIDCLANNLQPFKKGPFHMIKDACARVVLVLITGSYRLMPPSSNLINRGTIYVDMIGEIPKDYVQSPEVNYEVLHQRALEIYVKGMKRRTDEEVLGRKGTNLPWMIGFLLAHIALVRCLI